MKNSVKTTVLAASAIFAMLLGCTGTPQGTTTPPAVPVSFVSEYAPIEFTFPAGWYNNSKEHPYDLQCFSPSQTMNSGVFVYKKVDIASDSTPSDILGQQVADIESKRNNFEEIEAAEEEKLDDKTITAITYAGEKDSSRYYYRFSLIEFSADDSKFAVVLQVAMPGEWGTAKPILAEITRSAKSLPNSE